MSAPSVPPTTAAPAAPATANTPLPNPNVMVQAAKLSMTKDKPIQLDYYADTASGRAFVGEDQDTKERMLVKSAEEFTSLIQHTYKVGEDYIMETENSIYIAHGKIQKRRIQANQLREE
jgi:hypothetical protein